MKYYIPDEYTLCDRCRWNSDALFDGSITGYLCKPSWKVYNCENFRYLTGDMSNAIRKQGDAMRNMKKWWEKNARDT